VAALQERINLAALFAGQMEIAFGHFPSARFAVPRKDSLHLTARKPAYTTRQSLAGETVSLTAFPYSKLNRDSIKGPGRASDTRTCPSGGPATRWLVVDDAQRGSGNVSHGGTVNPSCNRKGRNGNRYLQLGAPDFYPSGEMD
jgi:hypothetical protein